MKYDFTTVLDRFNIGSTKWEEMRKYGITPEMHIVPMSNAEMEFYDAPEIVKGIQDYVADTVLAYFTPTQRYFDAVIGFMKRRHGWDIYKDWIVPYPGIHGALCMMMQTYLQKGEGAIVMPPTWPGFFHGIEENGCLQVDNPLIAKNNTYYIDYEDLERKCKDPNNKMLLFCSPANPVGRVWSKEELYKVGRICVDNDVLIVSDELHSDLVMPGFKHIPFATVAPEEFNEHLIICTAPSKSFNLAGLIASNIIIPNEKLREQFLKQKSRCGIFRPDMIAMKACEIAYTQCDAWLDECITVLDENRRYVSEFISKYLPMIKVTKMEGTYLMWLDMRALGLSNEELETALMQDAHVFFDDGYYFGYTGDGFERVNIACPTSCVKRAMENLRCWIESIPKK